PARPELGGERGANFLFTRRELGLRRLAADREVGTDFAFARQAVDRACHFTIHKHDALVAIHDLRDKFLEDVRLPIGAVEQLHQRSEVAAVRTDPEYRAAGESVERLQHHLAMLGEELAGEPERSG